ncbi:MAG TPA: SprT-like domain-containing protein [Gemmatimonadaceae bacterium]|nr:SprT-like domain-containing protein [Gemmatimonadaceae bacterium]
MSAGSLLRGALTRFLGRGGTGARAVSDAAQLALDFGAGPGSPGPTGVETVTPVPPESRNFPVGGDPRQPAADDLGTRPAATRAPDDRARAEALLRRLRALGLRAGDGGIERLRLTRNRTVMVSFRRGELRVHRGYLDAPEPVLAAVVAFVQARTRRQRAAAQRVILAHPTLRADGDGDATAAGSAAARRPRARERTLPEDEPMVRVLTEWHQRYNAMHFGGALRAIPIRVSRRLKTRLGHYTARTSDGLPAEIVIGRSHIRRHGWEEALHTLLHEMVHQWQDESGHALDHGRTFRRKAREVGIAAAARRAVGRQRAAAAASEHRRAG